jgi:hypothetical protein
VKTALALCSWLALGLPCAALFWRRGRHLLAIALLPFAGALALLLPWIAGAWTGGSLAALPLQAVAGALVVALAGWLLLRGVDDGGDELVSDPPFAVAASLALLVAAALLAAITGALLAQGWPGYGWDGLSIWIVRAKVLAQSAEFPAALFREPSLERGHWDYPLLLPALVGWFARLADLGVRELALPIGWIAACFVPALAIGLARALPAPLCVALALVPCTVPGLALYHFQAYADPLLVVTALAGFTWAAAGVLRGDAVSVAAGGIALACAAATKNEGVLWLLAASLGVAALARAAGATWPRVAGAWVRCAVPGLLLFALWRATCAHLGIGGTLPATMQPEIAAARLPELATGWAQLLLMPARSLPIAACVVAVVLLCGGRGVARAGRAAALLATPLLYTAALALVYASNPEDLAWHLATSVPRTLFGLVPFFLAAALLAPLLARRADADA